MSNFASNIAGVAKVYGRKFFSLLPYHFRYPSNYWKMRNFLNHSMHWNDERIKDWQLQKFKMITNYALKFVPAYNQLFNENNIKPDDIGSIEEIKDFPYVTKEMIRDNLKDFTSVEFKNWQLKYMTTGGSTGIPFGFYNTINQYFVEHAFIHNGWEQTGWIWGDRAAVLRGAFVGDENKIAEFDRFSNELFLSSYYLNSDNFEKYIKAITEFSPDYLQAYPSSAILLADLITVHKMIGELSFKAIFLGSENLYDWQINKLKIVFPKSILFAWYGHAEKAVLAMNCRESMQYHINPFYGITEIINENDEEVAEASDGEIIGTSFWNFATPFIRYRTMDYAIKGKSSCESCKTNYQLIERITGRIQEFIVSKSGRYISMTAINMHDDIFDLLKQFKFYQEEAGKLIFKYIPRRKLLENEINEILSRINKKLGDDITLSLLEVDSINRNQAGKFSFLEQKLNLKYGD